MGIFNHHKFIMTIKRNDGQTFLQGDASRREFQSPSLRSSEKVS